MEKRFVLFFIVTFLFIALYTNILQKSSPPPSRRTAPAQTQITENEIAIPQKTESSLNVVPAPQEKVQKAEFENFIVTFSLTGGYIKNIHSIKYDEDLPYTNIGFIPATRNQEYTLARNKNEGVLTSKADGTTKIFRFNGYLLSLRIQSIDSFPAMVIFHKELNEKGLNQRYQEFFYRVAPDRDIKRVSMQRMKNFQEDAVMAGLRDRYFCIVLFDTTYGTIYTVSAQKKDKGLSFTVPLSSEDSSYTFYVGPQEREALAEYKLDTIISYGMFHGIGMVMVKALHISYRLTKSWGISIIFLSIAIYVLLFPLTFKSSKGMKELKEFQKIHKREIEKLKEKYQNQPEKIHQATMELYKKYGVNPLKGCSSSCLPLFFQLPIIWAFWNVVPRALEFKGVSFLWVKDLSQPDHLFQMPFSLPFLGDWVNILPILSSLVMYFQMKVTSTDMEPEQAQQQKMMSAVFPVMIAAVTYHFPAALLLYWFTNSILTFVSQWKILRTA